MSMLEIRDLTVAYGDDQVLNGIDMAVKTRESTMEPIPSKNLKACQKLAEDYAWQAQVPSVRDLDLFWAILDKGKDSRVFHQVCARAGIYPDKLAEILNDLYPRPVKPYPSTELDSELLI